MLGKAVLGLVCVTLAGCGSAAASSTKPAEAPAPTVAAPVAPATREASQDLRRRWPFGAAPAVALYADLDGLVHTELFEQLIPATLGSAGDLLRSKQRECVQATLASSREIAFGSDGQRQLLLARLDLEGLRAVRTACLGSLLPVERTSVKGAEEAYRVGDNVLVVDRDIVLVGTVPLVEASLAAATPSPWPARLGLQPGQHAVWRFDLPRENASGNGSLSITSDKFRLDVSGNLPSEDVARMIEGKYTELRTTLAGQLLGAGAPPSAGLVNALSLTRQGNHLSGAFEVRGTTAEQAQALGSTAALAIYGVRRYINNAKTAEARNVIAQISKDIVTSWEREDLSTAALTLKAPSKLAAKKLTSMPAVPATVPRGIKYQSTPQDWQAWQSLRFSLDEPQYYQYEVIVAKDGKGAQVIARGDLDGDGKPSLFVLEIKLEPKTKQLSIVPEIQETDPEE